MARSSSPRPSLNGVIFFSILIIGSSFVHMHKLYVDYDYYHQIYSHWPPWLLKLRYAFSWLQRIAGITAAIGVLFYNNLCRRLVFAIGIFTISTVYWKHPYTAFLKHTHSLDQQYSHVLADINASLGTANLSFAQFTRVSQVTHWILDISFWTFWMWYFSRPRVKAPFIKKPSSK